MHVSKFGIAAAICVLAACSHGPATSGSSGGGKSNASNGSQWIANGNTACDKYLTPDVVAKILTHPAGKVSLRTPQACSYKSDDGGGSIGITLTNGGPAGYTARRPYTADPVPLAGVGDSAIRTMIGIEAVKGTDRGCSIDAGGAPGSTKVSGEALAKQLGDICNTLFAIP